MTVSVKAPTSTTGSIQLNGSDVLTIESDRSVDIDSNTLHVDATNNRVGIGTTNPDGALTIQATGASDITYKYTDGNTKAFSKFDNSDFTFKEGTVGADNYAFFTNNTERMRIDSSGKLNINSSSVYGPSKLGVAFSGATNWGMTIDDTASSNSSAFIVFATGGALRGLITNVNNTSVAYNTTSDYRLKENVAPMSGSIDRLKQLKPSTWTWIQNGSHGEGFVAHEAQAVVPEAVTGTKDEVNDDGNPVYQGIDQSKLVPLLTSALQEAITKIEDLETRIQALESA